MIKVINNIDIATEQLENEKRKKKILIRRISWSLFTSLVLIALVWGAYEVSIKYNVIQYIVEEYLGKQNDVAYAERIVKIVAEAIVATIAILTVTDWFRKSTRYISTEDLVAQGGTYSDRYLQMAEMLQHSTLLNAWPNPEKESLWWFEFQDEKGNVKKFAIELQKVINNLISEPAIDLDHRSYLVRATDDLSQIRRISVATNLTATNIDPEVEKIYEEKAEIKSEASVIKETQAKDRNDQEEKVIPEDNMNEQESKSDNKPEKEDLGFF